MTKPNSFRLVQDPSMSDAEFYHQRSIKPDSPHVGLVVAPFNFQTYIGGFHRFGGDEFQIAAAAKFKRLHELSQIGGARACDPEKEPVDGGGINPEAAFQIGADARKEFIAMQDFLGRAMFRRFEYVVIGGKGPTAYVRYITGIQKPNARLVSRGKVEVRRIANNLAVHFGLATAKRISKPIDPAA